MNEQLLFKMYLLDFSGHEPDTEHDWRLYITETEIEDIGVIAIVADWFEDGNLGRGLSPEDILEMLCNALDRKINPQGAVRFRNPIYFSQAWRAALEWYAAAENYILTTERPDGEGEPYTNVEMDDGDKARAALARLDKT